MNEDRSNDGTELPVTPDMMQHWVKSMFTCTNTYILDDGSVAIALEVELWRVDGLYVQLEFTLPMVAGLLSAASKVMTLQFPAPITDVNMDDIEFLFDRTEDRGERGEPGESNASN